MQGAMIGSKVHHPERLPSTGLTFLSLGLSCQVGKNYHSETAIMPVLF